MNDMEILRRAYDRENDTRDRRPPHLRSWEFYSVGASRRDINRLIDEGMVIVALKTSALTKYRLSEKGRSFVFATTMEREFAKIPAASILEAMNLVVGFDDLKDAIARAVEARRRINFLLEGPPACAKSIMLEGVRSQYDLYRTVTGKCETCGAEIDAHPRCGACGILCGVGHLAAALFRYRGHALCGYCLGAWKKLDRAIGLETLWQEFLNPQPKMFPVEVP